MSSFYSSFGWSDPLILPKCHLPRWLLHINRCQSFHLHSDDLSSTVRPELRVALRCRFKRHILGLDTNKNWQQMSTLVQSRTCLPVEKVLRRLPSLVWYSARASNMLRKLWWKRSLHMIHPAETRSGCAVARSFKTRCGERDKAVDSPHKHCQGIRMKDCTPQTASKSLYY